MKSIELDGQHLHLVARGQEKALLRAGSHEGQRIGALRVFRHYVRLFGAHPALRLALTKYRPDSSLWAPIVLLDDDRCIRISLEERSCPRCDWSGFVGLAFRTDLFVGVDDKEAARARALDQPQVPCPKCNATFATHVVWTEGDA